MKHEAKNIAMKVIQRMSSMKHFPASLVGIAITEHTRDPKMMRLTYNQIRRALPKLGYTEYTPPGRCNV